MRSKRITLTCSVILLTIVILFPSPSWSQDLEWTFPEEGKIGEIRTSPAIGPDGTIYIGSRDGNLYAVTLEGDEKWLFPIGSEVRSSPAVDSDGTIYVGAADAKLYAITPDGDKKWEFQTGQGKGREGNGVDSSPAIGHDGTDLCGFQ